MRPAALFDTPPRWAGTKRSWRIWRAGTEESRLAKRLRADVTWGRMPTYLAQQYAHDAILDGSRPTPDLKRLSKLGDSGKNPSRCWQDFRKVFDTSFSFTPHSICVPLKTDTGKGDLQIALPHALFSAMYHQNKHEFAAIMFGYSSANIKSFWESQRDHPAFRGHCMHLHPHKNSRVRYSDCFAWR